MIPHLDLYTAPPPSSWGRYDGEDAPVMAAMRADALLEQGDLEGYEVWKEILKAREFVVNLSLLSLNPLLTSPA